MVALFVNTPVLYSRSLSLKVGTSVLLKMEALQPTGSFKTRGISVAAIRAKKEGVTHLIASSGGNAGLAVAFAARHLGLSATIVVPESTPAHAKELIQQEGAELTVVGASWQEAHEYALDLMTDKSRYIHPFDSPLLWKGHSTLIDELKEAGCSPDAVVLSVGGGGLLSGVCEGLERNGWGEVSLLAVETEGAASFGLACRTGELTPLKRVDTVAVTLGAKQVALQALKVLSKFQINPVTVSDLEAVAASLAFADTHRVVVEPACGAALAALDRYPDFFRDKKEVVVIVCGGTGATYPDLQKMLKQLQ